MPARPNELYLLDNDVDEITISLNGRELRGWSYKDDDERRKKMLAAREFVEGYYAGFDAGLTRCTEAVDSAFRPHLVSDDK